jgi:hypothetical protein
MKLTSKYFDSIRIKPENDLRLRRQNRKCEWPGCDKPAQHKAPKGREAKGEYHHFCLEHVRQYNKSYNFFDGMEDTDVADFQRDALTGHRPTWAMGSKEKQPGARPATRMRDRYGLFSGAEQADEARGRTRRRTIRPLERKSLRIMELDETATPEQIKVQYKILIKRHHPDANGGSRDAEDQLREIIDAYRHLKSVGLC